MMKFVGFLRMVLLYNKKKGCQFNGNLFFLLFTVKLFHSRNLNSNGVLPFFLL
jgi:hypothetical protein